VDELLRRRGLTLRDLDGLLIDIGPGSFTGLRVGLSAVKGFSFGLNKPIYIETSLRTLAWQTKKQYPQARLCLSLLDARKKQLFAGLYSQRGESPEIIGSERVCNPGELGEIIRGFLKTSPPNPLSDAERGGTETLSTLERVASVSEPGEVGGGKKQILEGLIITGTGIDVYRADLEREFEGITGDQFLPVAPRASAMLELFLLDLQNNNNLRPQDIASLEPMYLRPADAEFPRPRIG
jgi:tRNA threonylcarbamoyl adenosine modification protein YeaZ